MFTPVVIEKLKEVADAAGYGATGYGVGKYMTAQHPDMSWPNHQITAMARGDLVPGPDKQCVMLKEAGFNPTPYLFSFAVDAALNDKRTSDWAKVNFCVSEAQLYQLKKREITWERAFMPSGDLPAGDLVLEK